MTKPYIPLQIAHAPIQAKASDLARIDPQMAAKIPAASDKVTNEEKHIHAAMLLALDQNVGAIEAELTKLYCGCPRFVFQARGEPFRCCIASQREPRQMTRSQSQFYKSIPTNNS
jgi:hypothetical protein